MGFWSSLVAAALLIGLAGLIGLVVWRQADIRADARAMAALRAHAPDVSRLFERGMVADLPEPAQRYLRFTIAEGTTLTPVMEITMQGTIDLGSRDAPSPQPMRARQVLASPHGLVWQLRAGPISGSDGALPSTSWTRFWLGGLLPMVRVGGGADHHRSAFGRVVAEGVFWAPASLLPPPGAGWTVEWEAVDTDTARALVRFGAFSQAVDISVDAEGAPQRVLIQRWSNENAEQVFREQPFGGYLSDFRNVGGYRLPFRVEGGNHLGTDDYFAFYKADVTSMVPVTSP